MASLTIAIKFNPPKEAELALKAQLKHLEQLYKLEARRLPRKRKKRFKKRFQAVIRVVVDSFVQDHLGWPRERTFEREYLQVFAEDDLYSQYLARWMEYRNTLEPLPDIQARKIAVGLHNKIFGRIPNGHMKDYQRAKEESLRLWEKGQYEVPGMRKEEGTGREVVGRSLSQSPVLSDEQDSHYGWED